MVQFRAIDKRVSSAELQRLFNENVNNLKREVLVTMAERIANNSPVDTGTYARSHTVSIRSGSFQPTVTIPKGAPRKVPPGPPQKVGLARMLAEIDTDRILESNNVVFRNDATHATYVERGGSTPQGVRIPARRVYASVRNEFNNIVRDAMAKLGMTSG